MLTFIFVMLLLLALQIARDWLIYKHRGHVRREHPDDPVIANPGDAYTQNQIDRILKK